MSKVHVVGRDFTKLEDEELYQLFDASGIKTRRQRDNWWRGLGVFASWWPEVYANLRSICEHSRPDFIFADGLDDAAIDLGRQLGIPCAALFPQMHPNIAPASYIPGLPGYQLRHLTSDRASLWDRMVEEIHKRRMLSAARDFMASCYRMHHEAGVPAGGGDTPAKPDFLMLVNSFTGMETPRDLPPLVQYVGPILSDNFPAIAAETPLEGFLDDHHRVLYVAFGSHVHTPEWRMLRLIDGIAAAMNAKQIDGVVWAMKGVPPKPIGNDKTYRDSTIGYERLFANSDPHWLFQQWVPQRAILSHPSVQLFLSHCGGSSTMEAAYHGVPVVAMGIYGDQLGHARRLEAAGLAIRLDKDEFSAIELEHAITRILNDGHFLRNALRVCRIAHANSERKHVAAHMIEALIYDHELRYERSLHEHEWRSSEPGHQSTALSHGAHQALRPCHLETADMRMTWMRRHNIDIIIFWPILFPAVLLSLWWRSM